MELFEEIRRGHAAGETIQGLAKKHGVHRRMVRQALASAIPPERKRMGRECPRLGPLKAYIDRILAQDRDAPRKQKHTAHRIFTRLREEHPELSISEATVRRYVAKRKRELGFSGREVYVPQSYAPGQEAQVDWFEATAKLGDERRVLQVFAMRSMASGDAFHRAYTNATQQAFLEGHEHAFAYFGGVFRTLSYDNLAVAVKKILRGYRREETSRMIAFRSHWGFTSAYCNPASGNEKGGVEGEVGRYRRNWLVPVPEENDLAALNEQLLAACLASRKRTIRGKNMTVGDASQRERSHLLALAPESFPIEEILFPLVVDGKGRVKVKTNWYSGTTTKSAGGGTPASTSNTWTTANGSASPPTATLEDPYVGNAGTTHYAFVELNRMTGAAAVNYSYSPGENKRMAVSGTINGQPTQLLDFFLYSPNGKLMSVFGYQKSGSSWQATAGNQTNLFYLGSKALSFAENNVGSSTSGTFWPYGSGNTSGSGPGALLVIGATGRACTMRTSVITIRAGAGFRRRTRAMRISTGASPGLGTDTCT